MGAKQLEAGRLSGAALLEHARSEVEPGLRAAVAGLPPSMRHISGYHLGWWDPHGTPEPSSGGKALRPALLLATVRALGGEAPGALAGAVAVELVHNFTLLHDDVIDHDPTRRHRPTAWTLFGIADAILTGDVLQALAVKVLAEDPHPAATAATARLADCMVELCEGQSADCSFEHRSGITVEQCLAMARDKTAALLAAACAIGAMYAGAAPAVIETMAVFGRHVGLAFQLIDDVLGIWGDPAVTGKPVGADLAVRKKSLPVVAALNSHTEAGAELAALYAAPGPGDAGQIARLADLVERAGGRTWALAQAGEHTGKALALLDTAVPGPEHARDLRVLADLLTRRKH